MKIVSILILCLMLNGCSLLPQLLSKSSSNGISATANIGDNKKLAIARQDNIRQGDNSGIQAAHDAQKIEAREANLVDQQQVIAKKVDTVINNQRAPWYLLPIIIILAMLFMGAYFSFPPRWAIRRRMAAWREFHASLKNMYKDF